MKRMLPIFAASIILLTGVPLVLAADPTGSGVILLEPSVVNKTEGARVQFGEYMSTLFTTFIAIAAALAVLMIVWGGIEYISSFSGSGKEQGKERITNAVFGLLLAVSAFLILQTVNPDLVSTETLNLDIGKLSANPTAIREGLYGPGGTRDLEHEDREKDQSEEQPKDEWGKCSENGYLDCQWIGSFKNPQNGYREIEPHNCEYRTFRTGFGCFGKIDTENQRYYFVLNKEGQICYKGPYTTNEECSSARNAYQTGTGDCVNSESVTRNVQGYPLCSNEGSGTADAGTWRYQGGIERQAGDMSHSLKTLLSCMRQEIPDTSIGQISSISDSGHIGKLDECNGANSGSNCAHSRNSCHYGGGTGSNGSMAVDFGDEWNKKVLSAAARKCDPGAYVLDEGNHLHVSTGVCPKN